MIFKIKIETLLKFIPKSRSRSNKTLGKTRLSLDLSTLVNNSEGSDVKFEIDCDGTPQGNNEEPATVIVYAHSVILRCRSQYFATMLDEENNWNDGVIHKPNISLSTFENVLYYIYTGKVRVGRSKNIIELIIAADEMNLEELGTECQNELKRIVRNIFTGETSEGINTAIRTHIVPALNFVDIESLSDVSQTLQGIVLPHISVIIKSSDAYNYFIKEISSEAIAQIIASDSLAAKERSVWDLALGWACHQIGLSKTEVEEYLNRLSRRNDGSEELLDGTLNQLKLKLTPLLPSIRFRLLDIQDYKAICDILVYFLPYHRYVEINTFFLNIDNRLGRRNNDERPRMA